VLRLVSLSGDKGRGVRALPAAQTWHMRRRRALACQGRPCSPSVTNMTYEEEEREREREREKFIDNQIDD